MAKETPATAGKIENQQEIAERLDRIERLTRLSCKEALNINELCEFTGYAKEYVYQLVHKRKIPFYKNENGKLLYFKKSEIENWMLATRVPTNEEIRRDAEKWCANRSGIGTSTATDKKPVPMRKGGAQ